MELDRGRADELTAFLAVARGASFAAAAAALGRHPSIISRRVASLEARLGVRLLERTTRMVRLTAVGETLAERVAAATGTILEAEQEASAGGSELRGRLRLAFPAAMGRRWLAPLLPGFLRLYPGLELEIDYSERHVDLVGERFDLAIRLGSLQDSRLISRKLAEHRIVMGASPGYLEHRGVTTSPNDLREHNLLRYTGPVTTPEWEMRRGDDRHVILPMGSFRSNDIEALLEGARQGVGIVAFGEWSMAEDFASGRLVRLLPDWTFGIDGGVYIVRPSAKLTPTRTRVFIEWIAAQFEHGSPWGDL